MQVSFFIFAANIMQKCEQTKKMPIFVIVFNVFIIILACKLLLFSIFAAKECCLMVNACRLKYFGILLNHSLHRGKIVIDCPF